jgi:hypothetical protein
MKRLIRIVCFAVAVGMAVYGGVMATYALAHALSLPAALTNLLPLAVLGVVWFIASRFTKYLQL